MKTPLFVKNGIKKFVLVTDEFAGLGFALDEINKNNSEVIIAYKPKDESKINDWNSYEIQGQGMVETIYLDNLIKKKEDYRDWYWVWDGNHNTDENKVLRQAGFKVLGGTEFTFKLENDREFGIKFAKEAGFTIPDYVECKSVEEGISYLEEHEDEAFVYKPNNEDSAYTTVPMTEEPSNANKEIQQLIKALGFTDYILQKKVKGIEVNVESTYIRGVPYFTFVSLENKRLHNGDLGSACGCSFEIVWQIPNDCELAKMTVRKFDKKMKEMLYTGFMDANVIISDYNEVNFIEFCARPGYTSHPNLFGNLASKTFLQYSADMINGVFNTQFKKGFGAAMVVFCDHYKIDLPIYVPETIEDNFYIYDGYINDDILVMGGFGKDIGIIMDHNYTPHSALEECLGNANKVKFSNIYYRTDVCSKEIPNSLIKRYEALQSMKVL